jgi:hypothetical protein
MKTNQTRLLTYAILAHIAVATSSLSDTIMYFRFEEGSGYGVYDETGVFSASFNGATSVEPGAGDTGYNGWSTYVPTATIPLTGQANNGSLHITMAEVVFPINAPTISMGTEFTVECFVNIESSTTLNPVLSLRPLYFRISEADGQMYYSGQFFDTMTYQPAPGLTPNEWHHIALVKTPGQYEMFLDGESQYIETLPPGTDGPYTSVYQYRYPQSIGDGFGGWIDEFRISDEALTPDQFLIVPEPNSVGLLLGGGFLILAGRLRRRTMVVHEPQKQSGQPSPGPYGSPAAGSPSGQAWRSAEEIRK